MGKMNVDVHRFLHLAVTTLLCDLSVGDRLELVGEWYQLECLLTMHDLKHHNCCLQ